jgi:phage terminase large subunit GpA-like protein
MVNVAFFKAEFYADLKKRAPTEDEIAQGYGYPPGYCHFPSGGNYGDEYYKQLCAEQLVSRRNRKTGRTKTEWQQMRARNEALDCRVYARAAAWDLGLDRMQDKHFRAYEAQLEALKPKPKDAEPTPAPRPVRHESKWLGGRERGWLKR